MLDYYRILAVPKDAPQETLKPAYIKRLKQFHPDIYKGADATAKTQKINEAYQTLKDPLKRSAYDRQWQAAYGGGAHQSGDEFADTPNPAGMRGSESAGNAYSGGGAYAGSFSSDAEILAFATGNFSRRQRELKQRIDMLCAAMAMDIARLKAAAESPWEMQKLHNAARQEFGAHMRNMLEENEAYYQGLLHEGLKPTTIMIVDGLKQTQENFIAKTMNEGLSRILANIAGDSGSAWGYNRSNNFGAAEPAGGELKNWGSFWWGFGLSLFLTWLVVIFAAARYFLSFSAGGAVYKRNKLLFLFGSIIGALLMTLLVKQRV